MTAGLRFLFTFTVEWLPSRGTTLYYDTTKPRTLSSNVQVKPDPPYVSNTNFGSVSTCSKSERQTGRQKNRKTDRGVLCITQSVDLEWATKTLTRILAPLWDAGRGSRGGGWSLGDDPWGTSPHEYEQASSQIRGCMVGVIPGPGVQFQLTQSSYLRDRA